VVITWLAGRGFLLSWSLVGLAVVAACLLAIARPFGQIQCTTTYLPSTISVIQPPGPGPLDGHFAEAQLCTNVASRGAFYGAP
jgi:hypothetical protein